MFSKKTYTIPAKLLKLKYARFPVSVTRFRSESEDAIEFESLVQGALSFCVESRGKER